LDKLLLDTYALVEITRGSDKGRRALAEIKRASSVYTGSLNLYELWYVVAGESGGKAAERTVLAIQNLAKTVPADDDISLIAAKLKLAHSGGKIGAVDFITAAAAMSLDATILTGDPHYPQIPEAKTKML